MTKQLDSDELKDVYGGISPTQPEDNGQCPFFFKASGKDDINSCTNCFYGHIVNGQLVCSSSNKR